MLRFTFQGSREFGPDIGVEQLLQFPSFVGSDGVIASTDMMSLDVDVGYGGLTRGILEGLLYLVAPVVFVEF